jgi:hypothetical protein
MTDDLPAKLTDDEYENAVLFDEEELAYIEPTDPHYQEVTRIHNELASISRQLPAKRRGVAPLVLRGRTNVSIAGELGCSSQTVAVAKDDPMVRRQMVLLQRLNHIQRGPSRESRVSLLWGIAQREKETRPSITLGAVNMLNKMDGVYIEEEAQNEKTVINIQNFMITERAEKAVEDASDKNDVIEGEFTPVTVNVPETP